MLTPDYNKEVHNWLANQPNVQLHHFGGWAPEQFIGSWDNIPFYYRDRWHRWTLETFDIDIVANPNWYKKLDFSQAQLVAEGSSPPVEGSMVQRIEFIIACVQDYNIKLECCHHGHDNHPWVFCPWCGTDLRGPHAPQASTQRCQDH